METWRSIRRRRRSLESMVARIRCRVMWQSRDISCDNHVMMYIPLQLIRYQWRYVSSCRHYHKLLSLTPSLQVDPQLCTQTSITIQKPWQGYKLFISPQGVAISLLLPREFAYILAYCYHCLRVNPSRSRERWGEGGYINMTFSNIIRCVYLTYSQFLSSPALYLSLPLNLSLSSLSTERERVPNYKFRTFLIWPTVSRLERSHIHLYTQLNTIVYMFVGIYLVQVSVEWCLPHQKA